MRPLTAALALLLAAGTVAAVPAVALAAVPPIAAASPTPSADVPAAAKPARKPTLKVSPARPLQGTAATFRTRLRPAAKRPVVLQRQVGSTWVTAARGRSKRTGKVVLKGVLVPGESRWRLTAKRIPRRHLRPVVSRVRPVLPLPRAELVSGTPAGVSSGAESSGADLSADGRYVVFMSSSPALVPGTLGYAPGRPNVFLRDRSTGHTRLVSHQWDAPTVAGSSDSFWPRISRDGRYVVFVSTADDLVADDDGGHQDVFRWDRQTGTTIRVSVNGMGGEAAGASYDPSMSADGNTVAFSNEADLAGDDDNAVFDVYVWRAAIDVTVRVSVDAVGGDANGPSHSGVVSGDGAYVAFSSAASDLVFNDTNAAQDVFRRSLAGDTTTLVSRGVSAPGDDDASAGQATISDDGRYVVFASLADNLVTGGPPDNGKLNLFVRDLTNQSTVLVSRTPSGAATTDHSLPARWISADGRRILYVSLAPELVPGDGNDGADALLWDRATGRSSTVLLDRWGGQPNGAVYEPVLSADGRWLGFYSTASDLLAADPNATTDAYVWRLPAPFSVARSAARRAGPKVTLTATPTAVTVGQAVTLKVRTRRAVKGQRATLQRRAGGSWATVSSARLPASRRLDLAVSPPAGSTSYRVKLARKGQTPGAVSGTVAVVATPQSATLALPTSALAGATVTAAASFAPARSGRPVQLQQATGGTWSTVATKTQDAGGKAAFIVAATTPGTFQYRVVTPASGPLAAVTSPVRTLVVTEAEAWTGETTLVSHDYDGGPANSYAGSPSISDDGRWVAYQSEASDLIPDDPDNDQYDAFLWDRATDTTVMISRSSDGGSLDRRAESPVLSGNGRYVFYHSAATNIDGTPNPMSFNRVYRWDRQTGETIRIGAGVTDDSMIIQDVGWSGDTAIVTSISHELTDDDYSTADDDNHLFRWTAPTDDSVGTGFLLVDRTAAGKPGNNLVFDAVMSDDGTAIAFTSWSTDLELNPETPVNTTSRHLYRWSSFDTPRLSAVSVDDVTPAAGDAHITGISGNGAVVGFSYGNDDLGVPTGGQLQALTWTPSDPTTPYRLVSHNVGATTPGTSLSVDLHLGAAGVSGVFRSFSPLDGADTNGFYDLYAWDDGAVTRIAQAYDGEQPNQNHGRSDLSGDGESVVFESYASNLTPVTTVSQQIFVAGVP